MHSIYTRSSSPDRLQGLPLLRSTGCLYLCEGVDSDRVLLLTARHVALPPSKHSNDLYRDKNNKIPHLEVIHIGSKAYQTAFEAIIGKISSETAMIDHYKDEINCLGAAAEGGDAK